MNATACYFVNGMESETSAIARGLRRRDPDLLDRLIEQYQHRLLRYLVSLTADRAIAEDLFQETWMRVLERGVRKEITSFGTFLSTLCHEFCHHLDFQKFGFSDSWHTRGFYQRAAVLYHYARRTPPKKLFWVPIAGGRCRIDWPRTNRSA